MTIPSAATKTHLDNAADDPKQARAELADLVDKFNSLRSHLTSSGITGGTSVLGIGNGLESSGGALRAKGDGATVTVGAGGIALADNGVSLAKMAQQSGAGVLVYLADGTPAFLSIGDPGQVLRVDENSPTGVAFGKTSGGWEFLGEKTGGSATIDFTSEITSDHNAYMFKLNGLFPNVDDSLRLQLKLAVSGWTVDDAAGNPIRFGILKVNGSTGPQANSSYIPLSADRPVDNDPNHGGLYGMVHCWGINNQINNGAILRSEASFRDSTSDSENGALVWGGVRDDQTIEEIVGFRFYWASGRTFDSSGSIGMWGTALPVS